ncbi:MAG: hypothetical protein A2X66_04100 [Ignavibacteria bacterium GWA2_54_16]|nr:MAG: hypothetical protein A2X66_04100 [Ignavibacteria bacterium GWA2_54_16]
MEHAVILTEQHRVPFDAVVSISPKESAAFLLSSEPPIGTILTGRMPLNPFVATERGLILGRWALRGGR